jgi:hypothetical protein
LLSKLWHTTVYTLYSLVFQSVWDIGAVLIKMPPLTLPISNKKCIRCGPPQGIWDHFHIPVRETYDLSPRMFSSAI